MLGHYSDCDVIFFSLSIHDNTVTRGTIFSGGGVVTVFLTVKPSKQGKDGLKTRPCAFPETGNQNSSEFTASPWGRKFVFRFRHKEGRKFWF
jgi:hypothetical protein